MVRHSLVAALAVIITINAQAPTLTTMDAYNKAVQSSQPTVIMFTGAHCGPCRTMKPHFHSIAEQQSDVKCYIVDTSCGPLRPLLNHLNVMSIPTLICCHEGKVYHRSNGGLTEKGIGRVIRHFHKQRTEKKVLQQAVIAPVTPRKKTEKRPQQTVVVSQSNKRSVRQKKN